MTIGCQLKSQDKNTAMLITMIHLVILYHQLCCSISTHCHLKFYCYLTTLFSDSLPCPMLLVFFHRGICPIKPIIIY